MPAPSVQELKKALQRAGFEVYRTRGDDVHLAERPRENLIMEAGVSVGTGESMRVRFVVRAQRADFQGEDDGRLFERARAQAAPATARGYAESATSVRSMLDPGDATHVLDTWFEVAFEKPIESVDEAIEEVRFALSLDKAAAR
jgi:predicted nucleotide-binding protein